jgi:hypothetical protein
VGRVQVQKATRPDEIEPVCWLIDVTGRRTYRQRTVVYAQRLHGYGMPYKKDPGTTLPSAKLHKIPNRQIDFFLEAAPSSIVSVSPDLGVSRLELTDAQSATANRRKHD